MNYLVLARGGRTMMGAGLDFIPDDEGSMWDPSVVTRAFDATPKKTYGAIVELSVVAARVAANAAQMATAGSGPRKTVDNLADIVRNATRYPASEVAASADWNVFRTWFLQSFWDFNGATAGAQYRAKRMSFWREIKESWDDVLRALEKVADMATDAAKKTISSLIPWWVWVVGGVTVVVIAGVFITPIVMPLITAKIGQKRIVEHRR